ncbi:hypothetical protein BD560DRAFT_451646 [Blakeslea trispora]|nr:hypothetical protein BD560DRAFT_451646 [Blakeslea trispora]
MIKKDIQKPRLTEDYKMKSEQYLEVIEAQKLIIKRLQKSVVVLKRKNEVLEKQNRELQKSYTNTSQFDNGLVSHQQHQSEVLQHPLDQQTLNINEAVSSVAPTTSKSTPILPPKSPFRQNHEAIQKLPKPSSPRRPPVLKLAKSNYTSLHQNISDIQKQQLETNAITSPVYQPFNNALSDPSLSSSSTSSSSAGNSPLLESDVQLSNSLPKHVSNGLVSPRYSAAPKSQVSRQVQREPLRHSTNSTPYMNESKSEPSTPVKPRTPRFDSLLASGFQSLAAENKTQVPDVNVKVVSYSLKTCHRGREASVFTIGLFRKEDSTEVWRVEKSLSDLILLDSSLKQSNPAIASHMKRLPERSLFASHAPAKVDERKDMIEEYLQQAITLKSSDSQPLLQDFLSSDKIQYLPITLTNDIRIKQGYLTKRGKKIGGWKARYFVLESTGVMKYYESKNGTFIGTINLSDSQVASQVQFDSGNNSTYRHAFVIFDKSNDNANKHIFCADSDQERDSWIEALFPYTSQTSVPQDIIDHCFSEDKGMDQFFSEPFSVENSENQILSPPPPPPAKDTVLDTINRQASVLANNTKSNSTETGIFKTLSSESSGASSDEINEDKKPKQKANRRSFWSRKMFSSTPANDTLPPISPQNTTYDYNHIQALTDLEETRGEKQVFGIPLKDAVALSRINDNYDLPAIMHRCIEYLEAKEALFEEGIYRLSGSSVKVKTLKKRFNDAGDVKLLEDVNEYHDIHAIAGLLKMWLRELPENILTEAALPGFLSSMHKTDKQDRLREVRRLISLLPSENYTLLRSLCAHLIRVIEHSEKNKMTLRNICIVFSATLGIPSAIFTMLLVEFDYIFWTDRCTDDEQEAALELEDTINSYMQTPDEKEDRELHTNPFVQRFNERQEVYQADGLRRNSIHYEDSAPKEFISLEKQLEGVYRESLYEDNDVSDEEPEVAYIASRHDANSKQR